MHTLLYWLVHTDEKKILAETNQRSIIKMKNLGLKVKSILNHNYDLLGES